MGRGNRRCSVYCGDAVEFLAHDGRLGDYNTTFSSRLAGIEQDLGPLSGLCAPGWGC